MRAFSLRVQVVILTYNHAAYIEQALDSVLAQQTDFPVEIIVGEDCSTDHTRQLLVEYQRRYPTQIRPVFQSTNVGMGANLRACLARCEAPYIATLEGDDYWLDPLKLQKQVDWLEAHPAYSMCFHRVRILDTGSAGVPPVVSNSSAQEVFGFPDFLRGTVAYTGSVLLRNRVATLPAWLFAAIPIDYALFLLQVEHGPAKMLPEVMGVYRVHRAGTWSGTAYERNAENFLSMYTQLQRYYAGSPHHTALTQQAIKFHLNIADGLVAHHQLPAAATYLRRALALSPTLPPRTLKSLLGVSSRWVRQYVAKKITG